MLQAAAREGAEAVAAAAARDVNLLGDRGVGRGERRAALGRIGQRLLGGPALAAPAPAVLQELLEGAAGAGLVAALDDPVEKVREGALELLGAALSAAPRPHDLLPRVVPAVRARLAAHPSPEPSEEVRLALLRFLTAHVLAPARGGGAGFAGDVAPALCHALADPFAEAKREACRGVELLGAGAGPGELAPHAVPLLRAICANAAHLHAKVRQALVGAIGAVMGVGGGEAAAEAVGEVLVPCAGRLVADRSAAVKLAACEGLGRWLGAGAVGGAGWGPASDAAAPLLLPLLLQGVGDEEEEVARRALDVVHEVGVEYGRRARPPPADAMETDSAAGGSDVCMAAGGCGGGDTAASSGGARAEGGERGARGAGWEGADRVAWAPLLQAPPYRGRRPSGESRALVQALLPELLPPVLKALREWTTDRRLQAAKLLHTMAVLGEGCLAEHMPRIVAGLCNAAGEDDAEIAQRIVAAVHVVGAVVAPAGWLPPVLEHADGGKAPPSQRANALVVLGGLLHGARAAGGGLSVAELSAVTGVVTSEGMRGADHVGVRRQMLSVVANVVELCGPQCGGVARELYLVLLQLQAARADPELQRRAAAAAEALAAACGLTGGAADLCAAHSEALLDALAARSGEWADDSPDRLVFAALLRSCPPAELGRRMGRLVGILRGCLEPERDGRLRIATLQLLDELLDSPTQRDAFRGHAPALLREALLPPLVWQVGKVAAAVRFHAVVALGSLLRHRLASGADLEAALAWDRPALLPNLHAALEEDHYADSRLAACHAAEELFRALGEAGGCLTYEQCRAVYPELTKRLDDSEDRVRAAATRTIRAFYAAMGGLDATNVGYLLKGMLIHMDDANPDLQEAVCAAVEELARAHPAVVRAEVGQVRDKHRSKHFCDRCLAAAAAAAAGAPQ